MKCKFSVSKAKVLGHIISLEGIAADPEKIEAIRNLAIPRNVAKVRSFLGMVNHVSKVADHLASKTKPLRKLLENKNTWVWGQPQDQPFTEIKEALTTAAILALYDPDREVKVNADASSYWIGGVVMQQQDNRDWKPISYVSRALSLASTRKLKKNVWHLFGLANDQVILFGENLLLVKPIAKNEAHEI